MREKGGEIMEEQLQHDFQPEQQTLFDLQELAVVTTGNLGSLKEQKRLTQQMLKDALLSSETYVENESKVKEQKKILAQTKEAIVSKPENAELVTKLKDIAANLKEKQQAISDYALEYERLSGRDTFEKDGEIFTIVKTAKLAKALQ